MFEKYRTKKEIEKRIKSKNIDNGRRYLVKMLQHGKLLSPTTRDAATSKLGDSYLKESNETWNIMNKEWRSNITGLAFHCVSNLLEAAMNYAYAGEINKAKNLLSNEKYKMRFSAYDDLMKSGAPAPSHYQDMKMLINTRKNIEGFIEEESKRKGKRKNSLEKYIPITSIVGVICGLFFLSSNVTGNVIGNMTNSTSNWIGGILFIIGLIGSFFWFKSRKR